jgi:hypothetical protein
MDHVPMPPDVKAGMQDRSVTITALPSRMPFRNAATHGGFFLKKKQEIPTAKTPVAPRINTGIRQEPSGGAGNGVLGLPSR